MGDGVLFRERFSSGFVTVKGRYDFEAYYELGDLLHLGGDDERALSYLKKAENLAPYDERLEKLMSRIEM